MILIAAGTRNLRSYDAQLAFAAQLADRGYQVCIDSASLPEETGRARTYEAAPFLMDRADIEASAVFILGAEAIDDSLLSVLWEYELSREVPVVATGRFADHQAYLGAKAKLAYALGREAEVIDLSAMQSHPLLTNVVNPLVSECEARARPQGDVPVVTIALGPEALETPEVLPCLSMMGHRREYRLQVIASGKQKDLIKSSEHRDLSVLHLTEFSPMTFARGTDVLVVFGQGVAGERMASVAVNLMATGGVVVDCTDSTAIVDTGAPALRGPKTIVALDGYLTGTVLRTLGQIGEQVARSPWQRSVDIKQLETIAGLPAPAQRAHADAPKTVFFPTNGVGLGHARRCTIIAEQLPDPASARFAAFPSCLPMIQRSGFDCYPLVSRSEAHLEVNANDVLTYRRLQQALGPSDRLVFDGGYVFDSVYRTVLEREVSALWVRRGLWPKTPSAQIALDRETVFDRVIVPSEAFPELNDQYTFGAHVHTVGPIVKRVEQSPDERAALRERLQARFDLRFDKLVVSMLGGGVASDRIAHLQMLCATLAERPECLHLVVVWPNSTAAPVLYQWPNTRVVQTLDAVALALAADTVVSAAGYNSVHEILYHRIPTIFVPQSAPYLDDQTRRVRAMEERGLCAMVEETGLLQLDRALRDFLDGDAVERYARALAAVDLPEPGGQEAARLIAERWERE